MPSTIRVRAISSGETTEVQALIQHPMDSGFVKDANVHQGIDLRI